VLWSFPGYPGPDTPYAGLVLGGSTLYGTSSFGGTNNYGTIFKLNTDGSNPQVIYTIGTTNNDGDNPVARLLLSGNTLYGTSPLAGNGAGDGLVFSLNTSGGNFQMLKFFGTPTDDSSDGYYPTTGLVLNGNTLFGTTADGGNTNRPAGTVFEINTDGSDFAVRTRFEGSSAMIPDSDLILNSNILYGTTQSATNSEGVGTVFKINTDGTGLQVLHVFENGLPGDGSTPDGPLALSGNTLYGTTQSGSGNMGNGTVFGVNTDGTGYTLLHSFSPGSLNYDGELPYSGLVVGGGQLYGTADRGGTSGYGTIFSLTYRSAIPTNLVYNPDGSFSLTYLLGTNYLGTNYTYILQATTNLAQNSWQSLATNLATTNLWQITDINAKVIPARFYRVISH